jgi:hypothetical protein
LAPHSRSYPLCITFCKCCHWYLLSPLFPSIGRGLMEGSSRDILGVPLAHTLVLGTLLWGGDFSCCILFCRFLGCGYGAGANAKGGQGRVSGADGAAEGRHRAAAARPRWRLKETRLVTLAVWGCFSFDVPMKSAVVGLPSSFISSFCCWIFVRLLEEAPDQAIFSHLSITI